MVSTDAEKCRDSLLLAQDSKSRVDWLAQMQKDVRTDSHWLKKVGTKLIGSTDAERCWGHKVRAKLVS